MSQAALLAERWRGAVPRLTFFPAMEAGAAFVLLLLFSNALIAPLLADPADPDGGVVLRLLWPPVYLASLLLIALSPARVWRTALRAWPVMMLAALTMMSTAWSLDPGITLRRSLAVMMTAVFGLWLAARFSWPDLIRLIAAMFAVVAVGSLIAGALFPGFGVMQEIHPGAWRGLWWEKNTLGAVMAWGGLAFCAAAAAAKSATERRAWLGFVVLALLLVLLSTSKTALLASMIAVGGPAGIALARRGFGFAASAIFVLLLGVAALIGVLLVGPGVILEALGRDATLTGRTEIWVVLTDQIGDRPLTGYGYGAFWAVEDGPAYWVRQETAWLVPTAHNAWLETALAIGVPGAAFAFLVVLSGLAIAARRLFAGVSAYWALPFLTSWLVVSFSESNLLEQNGLVWLMVSTTLAKLLADRER
ncbi:O-antigen ligase family protein [Maricaulaceae bacterium MS644]